MATKAATKATAPEATPTSVSAWKKPQPPLELPSGNFLKVRRAGFQAFMAAGIIPNSLMATVQDAINRGVAPEAEMAEMVSKADDMSDLLQMIDDVCIFCAVEPTINPLPTKKDKNGKQLVDLNAKEDELLYIDEVDDEDKMFIFQWATGGTRDIEQFRREAGSSLESVRAGEALGSETE